ncbi:MAG: hypothetical protein IJI84_05470 [Clostridia bacterium]|nr:hypothetical protein [Clostridia bacterium]
MAEMEKTLRPRMPLPNEKKIPSPPKNKPQLKKLAITVTKLKAPMLPDKLLKVTPEQRKYATSIANIIINCNADLKQYKKVVPKEKVYSEKNKEQIIYAILQCKNLKTIKEKYKNSLEFLESGMIEVFHKNKTPEDVTRSLNAIIDRLKKEKRTAKLGGAGKKYLLDARNFIERKSKFPQAIKIRCLNEFCEFIEMNIKILSKTYNKFKEIVDDTDFYEALQDNSFNTFEKFQKEFIKNFKLSYKKVLKPLEK